MRSDGSDARDEKERFKAGSEGFRFSVIIPAYNEEKYLPALLDSIDRASEVYGRRTGGIQVVVADNMSTDATARIAAQRGCRVVPVEKRAIAAARNGGARAAEGEILCFVDADTRIHEATFCAIDQAMANEQIAGGATGVTLERWSAGIAAAYAMILPLVWLTGIDTGVVFCRRRDFEAAGGYDESLRIAEDVAFLYSLKRVGRGQGKHLARLRHAKAIASLRKFDQYGDWHYVGLLPYATFLFLFRRRAFDDFVSRYWYRPER